MYFNEVNLGEALAILDGIQAKRINVSDDHFSQSVQAHLNKLQIRASSVTKTFSSETLYEINSLDSSKETQLEDCFIYLFITSKDTLYCESFYKAVSSSFTIFEKFCTVYKDFLNTQAQLENLKQKQRESI
ncbi:MAG: hypothetical protein D8M58_18460 [Calditrichaeota bacterium]|nr:MAG: hypothetical protein DWQ03_11690 [Calditrichota bacterium]MBL1207393.1 hypothetical protein [Calditrichota bacterium]NOG47225.1 hypothetical protein [Calditrichota bacterium]